MKKKIFQFRCPCDGSTGPLYWIDEEGTLGSYVNNDDARKYIEFGQSAIWFAEFAPDYADIFYEYDSDYEDAFFTLVAVVGQGPPFEGWEINFLVGTGKGAAPFRAVVR